MNEKTKEDHKKDVVKRLRYAEGHVRAVAKMVDEDAYCLDIINQNHAVIEALRKVNQMILEGYLGECAWDAVHSKDMVKRKKAIAELVSLYSKK
jgi:DNA-binding FrmR family transcriptional regulator